MSTSTAGSILETAPLPPALTQFVQRFVSRSRQLRLIQAAGVGLAFVLIWTLAWALFDRLLPIAGCFRCVLLLIESSALVMLLVRPIHRLLSRTVPWHLAAAAIENRDPQFGGGLQTVLSQSLMPARQRGSAAMLQQVVQETAAKAARVDPRSLLPASTALRPAAIAASALVLMLVLLAVPWLDLPRLLKRQLMPFSNTPPVTTTRLYVSPGSVDVIEGEPLKITVRADRIGDSQPLLQWHGDDPVFASSVMLPSADGYSYEFASIDRPLTYRVSGGDATSALFEVHLIPRPTVSQLRVTYGYPAWTELPPNAQVICNGDLEGPTDTVATVSVVASQPLAKASAVVDGRQIDSTPSVDPAVRTLAIPIRTSGSWHVDLTGANGVTGTGPSGMTLRATPPQPPLANLQFPSKENELRLHPLDVLTLGYEATDQFALSKISAEVAVNSAAPFAIAIPLGANHRSQSGSFDVDLAQLAVNLGDIVTITLIAQNKAGLRGKSEPCRIVISPQSIDMNAEQRLAELREAARLANLLSDEVQAASKALEQSPPGDAKENRDEQVAPHLAAADAVSAGLSRQLLRALAHSNNAALSNAIMRLVDDTQRSAAGLEAADSVILTEMRDPLRHRLYRLVGIANDLRSPLETLWTGEFAAHLLAESVNAKADEGRAAGLVGAQADAVRRSAEHALADISAGFPVFGIDTHLDPQDPNVNAMLQQRIDQTMTWARGIGPVDFASAAAEWSSAGRDGGTGLVARLTIASQAEAVRPDGDFIWARDLQLSARAARRIDTTADLPASARSDYPAALRSLQQLNVMRVARAPIDQLTAPLKAADEARRRMRLWAGETDPASEASSEKLAMDPERAALEAAAAEAERRIEEKARLQHATTMDADDASTLDFSAKAGSTPDRSGDAIPEPSISPAELEKMKRMARAVRRLERLAAEQQTLRNQTAAASDADLKELATEQRALTDAIQNARPEENQSKRTQSTDQQANAEQANGLQANPQQTDAQQPDAEQSDRGRSNQKPSDQSPADHEQSDQKPPDADAEDAPMDSREAAMNAIRSAQERLTEMPKEIEKARQAEEQQHEAQRVADEAQRQADSADPEAKAAAEMNADDARAAVNLAKAQATSSQVSPDEAADVAASLRKFAPEATPAVEAIDEQLNPALSQMRQMQSTGDHDGSQRSARAATEAVAEVQHRLKEGLQGLLKRDAMTTAKFFSSKAAQALSEPQPNRAAALRLQRGASAALEQAWDDALHSATGQRLAEMPSMSAILRLYPAEGGSGGPGSLGAEPAPAEREWGRLRQQQPEDLSAGSHEIDPPEFQDALRVYFRDLANEDAGGKR